LSTVVFWLKVQKVPGLEQDLEVCGIHWKQIEMAINYNIFFMIKAREQTKITQINRTSSASPVGSQIWAKLKGESNKVLPEVQNTNRDRSFNSMIDSVYLSFEG
jgi:hypothetical protein